MATPEFEAHLKNREWGARRAFRIRSSDGLLSCSVKLAFGCSYWRCSFNWLVRKLEPPSRWLSRLVDRDSLDRLNSDRSREMHGRHHQTDYMGHLVRRAMDLYIGVMTGFLLLSFIVVMLSKENGNGWPSILVLLCCVLFTLFRFGEILSVFAQNHLSVGYKSPDPVRAVLNTFWHYGAVNK